MNFRILRFCQILNFWYKRILRFDQQRKILHLVLSNFDKITIPGIWDFVNFVKTSNAEFSDFVNVAQLNFLVLRIFGIRQKQNVVTTSNFWIFGFSKISKLQFMESRIFEFYQ